METAVTVKNQVSPTNSSGVSAIVGMQIISQKPVRSHFSNVNDATG
jgi:hypothetical protein